MTTIIEDIEKKSSALLENLKVYVSAPYQTKSDLVKCQTIEGELSDIIGLTYSSSRIIDKKLRSQLVDVEREEKQQRIYANNNFEAIQKIMSSALFIAVINDRDDDHYRWLDIGIARTLGKLIVLFTDNKNILEGSFNFPICIINDFSTLSKVVTKINEVYNKTSFIERTGNETRFYPVSEELRLTIEHSLHEVLGG